MEYERIDKAQTGMLSPCKLRANLFGPQQRRKGEGKGSCNSSPIKSEDAAYAKRSLLLDDEELDDKDGFKGSDDAPPIAVNLEPEKTISITERSVLTASDEWMLDSRNADPAFIQEQLKESMAVHKMQTFPNFIHSSWNMNLVHPIKPIEDNSGSDGGHDNASSSGFEFHKAERNVHGFATIALSRPLPSKWNDAEKWIVSKQSVHSNYSKKISSYSQANRPSGIHTTKVASDALAANQRTSIFQVADVQKNGSSHPEAGDESAKFTFSISASNTNPGTKPSIHFEKPIRNPIIISKWSGPSHPTDVAQPVPPTIRAVSMRDMGTEMTPTASQDPSRTGTPVKSTTPTVSPGCSMPSTPRGDVNIPFPTEASDKGGNLVSNVNEVSEIELRLKTAREIKDLGVKLGKMNIAAWASQEEVKQVSAAIKSVNLEHFQKNEFDSRAAEWEEVEKAKHDKRYKDEVAKIQAWENRLKAKAEAEMRRIEVQMEHMKSSTQERLVYRLAAARQQAEERQKAAIAKRDQQAARAAEQAEYIRQTGHIPRSYFFCCHLE